MGRVTLVLSALALLFAVAGCGASRPAWVRTSLEDQSPEFQKDFKLVELRCSQCHGLDKLKRLYRRSTDRETWELEVEDMAAREGSKIRNSEIGQLTDLLLAWSQSAPK